MPKEQSSPEAKDWHRQEHDRLVDIGREVLLNAPQLLIDGDVEADGRAGYGSLASIGGITPDGQKFYIELKPDSELHVPSQREFCENHGLERARLLKEGVDPIEAITKFVDWTNQVADEAGKKPVLSVFNGAFDFGFIDLYCLKAGLDNPYGIAPFDLKSKVMGYNGAWDWKATSKGNIPKIFLPDGDFTHNALEDAAYQQQMHFAVAGYEVGDK